MPQNTITLPDELVARAHEQGLTMDQLAALAAELIERHLRAEREEARARAFARRIINEHRDLFERLAEA